MWICVKCSSSEETKPRRCRGCSAARSRKYHAEHRALIKHKRRLWYITNRDKNLQKCKEYNEQHKEEINRIRREHSTVEQRQSAVRRTKEWGDNNKEKIDSYRNKPEFKEKNKARAERWKQKNPERVAESKRLWNLKNKEKRKRQISEYVKARPEVRAACAANRRARKRKAQGTYSGAEILSMLKSQAGKCANIACRATIITNGKKLYHVDHVVALANGGSNWIENLQLLCRECNQRKHTKTPERWAHENGLLFS